MTISATAARLKAEGKDIISLAAGEPDFDTPQHIKDAAIQAINAGFTKYTSVGGTTTLVQSIIKKFSNENQLNYDTDQILVSCGCKHSIYNCMQALLNPQDEVILPSPYWVSYPDMIKLAGAETVIIKASAKNQLKITPEQLQSKITNKTKLLIFNSPSNPTGAYYTAEELANLGAILIAHPHVLIACDDIYEHIIWNEKKFQNIVNVCPELYSRSIVFNGVSKAYAMTGWRIGYAAGPAPLINAMKKIQSQSTSCPTSISQVAAQTALEGDQSYIAHSKKAFQERHDYVYQQLNQINGVNCTPAQGTFYIFPDFTGVIERIESINNDIELAEYLLDEAKVSMVPGSAFGAPGHMRLSFATSIEALQEALKRLQKTLAT